MVTVPSVQGVVAPPTWSFGEYRLRALRLGDETAWHSYLADPRVLEHTSFPELDIFAVQGMVRRQLEGYAEASSCRWALVDAGDSLVGTCGFSNWSLPHSHAELVYDLHPDFWGRGLMRGAVHHLLGWAFGTAGFNRVHALVMTSNAASIRLLESFGFVREGSLRQYRIARGVARDFYMYALLHHDAGTRFGAPLNS